MRLVHHLRRNTISYIALFVALSGSAYAATALPLNSVGTAQVKNHSLLKVDFRNGQIPAGKNGSPGAPGERGPAGSFDASNVSVAVGPVVSMCVFGDGVCAVGSSLAQCAAGSVPIGGGWYGQDGNALVEATVSFNGPTSSGGWGVVMVNDSSYVGGGFQAVADCATGGVSPLIHQGSADMGAIRQSLINRLADQRQ
jgi:hypothetical protein